MPPVYSAYRAWGDGIGDCPSAPLSGWGNQYIYADPKLWRDAIARDLGKWLKSLARSENELCWAAFPCSGWHFVASVRGAARSTYFAHARGWLESEWDDPTEDPGVWLGDLDAFDHPWKYGEARPPERRRAVGESVRQWKDPVNQEAGKALLLLAHLYRAVERGETVIWRVRAEEFRPGSPLMLLVAFARAALPLDLKKRAAICVNPRSGDDLSPADLVANRVSLLVLDESEVIPSASTVLSRNLDLQIGVALQSAHLNFAEAVTDQFKLNPDALLLFSVLAGERLPRCSQISSADAMWDSTHVVYDLAVAKLHSRLDRLFDQRILPDSRDRKLGTLNWLLLVRDDEIASLEPATIAKAALMDVPTADSRSLRDRVWIALRNKGKRLDEAIALWWRPDLDHGRLLLDMAADDGGMLCDASTAANCLNRLPAAAAKDLLLDPVYCRRFLQLAPAQPPETWLDPVLTLASEATQLFVAVAGSTAPQRWLLWLDQWVVAMAASPDVPPSVPGLIARLPGPAPNAGLPVLLAYGEMCIRFASGGLAGGLVRAITNWADTDDRREEVLSEWRSGNHSFLSRYLPTVWILEHAGKEPPADLLCRLNSRMTGEDYVREASYLLEFGLWLRWRRVCQIQPEFRARCAAGWLRSPGGNRTLEEWKLVLQDSGADLTAEWVRALTANGNKVPWIDGFETEQLRELHRRSADLEADLEIYHLRPSVAGFPEAASRWLEGVPQDTLRRLDSGGPLTLDEARRLARQPGKAREKIVTQYIKAWIGELRDGNALSDVDRRWPWSDSTFRQLLARFIVEEYKYRALSTARLWKALDAVVQPGDTRPDTAYDSSMLKALHQGGFPRVALYLDPTFRWAPVAQVPAANAVPADPLLVELAEALAEGRGEGESWTRLSNRVRQALPSATHPLQMLTKHLLRLPEERRRAVAAFGWAAYRKAATAEQELLGNAADGDSPLPVYALWAAMDPARSRGEVALGILLAKEHGSAGISPVWLRALVRAVRADQRFVDPRNPGDDPELAVGILSQACRLMGLAESSRKSFAVEV